jgi:ABC-2 type transport system permease protein
MVLQRRTHHLIRTLCLGVTVASLSYVASRAQIRRDLTSEGLSEISQQTRDLIDQVAAERPVVITAYVSKEVPKQYVGHRTRLLNLLRELEARSADALTVRIFEPELHSDEAQEAQDKYHIVPRQVLDSEAGRVGAVPIFLGVAMTSGPREEVIEFLDRGLSVEYELARALQTVVQNKRRVVGVLRNDTHLMGNFDMATRQQMPAWRIVEELRKQYEVRSVNPGTEIPADVDALLVPQVSSLSQPQLDKLYEYVDSGRPTLLVADPMPAFNIRLSPTEPMLPKQGGNQGMFGGMGGGTPGDEKGDYRGFLKKVGVDFDPSRVIYDTENPNPRFVTQPHIAFLSRRDGGQDFAGGSPIVDGLAQVVAIFGGQLEPVKDSALELKPLLTTSQNSGYHLWDDMVDRSNFLFGLQGPFPPRTAPRKLGENVVLAAQINAEGKTETVSAPEPNEAAKEGEAAPAPASTTKTVGARNVIVLSDLDMFSDLFFSYHERGGDVDGDGLIDIRFDNVTFLLNCFDSLMGDERFIELRKRQPGFRRLLRVDEATEDARIEREKEISLANREAEERLAEAQKELDAKVDAIRQRQGLDETTKAIMMKQQEEAENRRLKIEQEKIEREKERHVSRVENEHMKRVDEVQNAIRLSAVLLPPLPAIGMGLWVFARRRRREAMNIPASRRKK